MPRPTLALVVIAVLLPTLASAQAASASTTVTPQPSETGERVRLRGGFSFNGGGGLGTAAGGTAAVAARVGVQFNRWFSTYYQPQPILFLAASDQGVAAGFIFANSLLANFTLGDFFDVGVGPSLDVSAIAACAAGVDCAAAQGLELGVHGRLAVNLGRNESSGPRSGLSIGLDVHPMFTAAGPLFLATLGLGGEWF